MERTVALRGENRLLHHAGCLHVLNIPYFALISDKICIVFVCWLSCFIGRGGFLSWGLASKKGLQQLPIVLVNLLKIRWLLTAGDWLLFQVNAHFVIFFFLKSQFILSSTKAFNTHGDLDVLLLVIADVTKKEEQTVARECFL